MSQQKQAPLPRQEFQEWLENAAVPVLVLQKGKHLGSVVKVPATPEIDYLFGCETFYGERISWSDRLEFCGLYDRQHQALHLLDDPLPNFVSGLTEEECQDSTAFGKRIAQEVDRYVEAAISNERSRLSVRELTSERNINSYRYYKGTEAGREVASLVFSGEKPDVQFHSEYYTSLTEDTLLSYRKAVTQVGTAWGLPIPDTQRWLDLIRQEEIAVTQAAEPEKVNHVMEEKDLPINASGLQTLDNIWGLFETAVKLNSADGRREMYALARELSECQNLTDWIIKSQTENEGAQVSMACTQN